MKLGSSVVMMAVMASCAYASPLRSLKAPACDVSPVPEAAAATSEASCVSGLPAYYNGTSEGVYDDLSPAQKLTVLDTLCTTPCGALYTTYMYAARKLDSSCARNQMAVGKEVGGKGEQEKPDLIFEPSLTKLVGAGSSPAYKPDKEFPGLLLGCKKDVKDDVYCALKPSEPDEGKCDFFLSCCYGDFLAGAAPADVVDKIEKMCPGSNAFANKTC